jgi:chemotaxis protein MotB
MARKKQRHEEHPDERWLITYADVLTLMFVLFMVLFSISVVNTGKFEELKQSLSSSLSSGVGSGAEQVLPGSASETPTPVVDTPPSRIAPELPVPLDKVEQFEASTEGALEDTQLEEAREAIEAQAATAGLGDRVSTTLDERGLAVRLETDDVLFSSGSATLRPGAGALLTPVARAIRPLPNPVRVEGHTDPDPIATAPFPSNWELSTGRSGAVVRHLIGDGVPPARLQSVGFAATRPIADNDTAAGRAGNRRVEILVLRLQGVVRQNPAAALGG